MATFTAGTRDRDEALLSNLARGHKHFRKALGNMMKHKFFRRHVRGLYIGVEYGTPKRVCPDGIRRDISFHQHAHFLYEPKLRWDGRVWSKDQWSRLRRWCRLKMAAEMRGWRGRERERGLRDVVDGVHCELGKRIEDVNEVCKYPFKDADIDTLIELGGPVAIRTFVEQTKGLRYSTPVGDLKKLRFEVKMASERFVIVSTPDGKVVDRAQNWNLFRPDPWGQRERRNRRAALRRNLRPEVIEKRRAKLARRFCSRVRRPLWRLCVLEDKLRKARRNIEARECPLHWHGVIEAIEQEKRGLFSFLLEAFETAPRALAREGLADQLAAPWLGDLRAYFARCGFRCEFDAIMREGLLDADETDGREINAKERKEKRTGGPVVNLLMARCAPFASGYWRVTQPVAAVVGYNGDFEALCEHTPLVRETAERSRAHIAAALAVADRQAAMPALRTRAPGGRAHACLPGPHYPNNSQGPAPPWAPAPDFWPPEWAKTAEEYATSPLQTA
jgi:hypothetical protein